MTVGEKERPGRGRDMLALPRQAKSIRTMRQTKSKGHGGTMLELAEKM